LLPSSKVELFLDRGDGDMPTTSYCDDRAMVEDTPTATVIAEFRDPEDQ
jgi:hypothetical protein